MQDVGKLKEYAYDLEYLDLGLKTNRNPKPVGQHSIDVANILLNCGYRKEIVRAGLLHDLVEDTDVTLEDIKNNYGEEIANLVDCMTYDIPGDDYDTKYIRFTKSLDNALKVGTDALVIEAADFISNSPYYHLANTKELKVYLKTKYEYFMKKAKPIIGKENIWNEIERVYKKYVKEL